MLSPHDLVYIQHLDFDLPQGLLGLPKIFMPQHRSLYRVHSVAREANKEEQNFMSRLSGENMLAGLISYKIPVAMFIYGQPHEVAVSLGTWVPEHSNDGMGNKVVQQQRVINRLLQATYSSADIHPQNVDMPHFPYGGIAVGIPSKKELEFQDQTLPIDRLIRSLRSLNYGCLVLAEPVHENVITAYQTMLLNELREVQTEERGLGTQNPLYQHYQEMLQNLFDTSTLGQSSGMWRTAVYLLGDAESYPSLVSAWQSSYSGSQSIVEPIIVRSSPDVTNLFRRWSILNQVGRRGPRFYHRAFEFQTLITSPQLAAYITLPRVETSGFQVKKAARWDVIKNPTTSRKPINLGKVVHDMQVTENEYNIDSRELIRHICVLGIPGSGKTTTAKSIIKQLDSYGVPSLIIEPVKTEYRVMLTDLISERGVQVFTLGDETVSPLRLNPFELIPGTPVNVHIDLLRTVFNASFGLWTPLPQVLEQCLQEIYIDRGWDLTTNTNVRLETEEFRADAFPTLTELIRKIEHVTKALGYDRDIEARIQAALITRLQILCSGSKGRMLDVRRSTPFQQMLDKPTILELERIGSDDDKAFIMGLLLIRLIELRRTQGFSHELRHLFVLEEAHRLISSASRISHEGEANPRGQAVEAFANLLLEMRAYGQGVLIADQSPSKLAPEVIKHTNIKIVHRILENTDRDMVAGSTAMDKSQKDYLPVLPVGQAALYSEGDDSPILTQITAQISNDTEWPTDNIVRQAMANLFSDKNYLEIFKRHPRWAEDCQASDDVCKKAAQISQISEVARVFDRTVLSTIEDVDALDRRWQDIFDLVTPFFSERVDNGKLFRCFIIHSVDRFVSRRGAQSQWTYMDTSEFGSLLSRILLEKLDMRDGENSRHQFKQFAHTLHRRTFDPYPLCGSICQQEPHVCLYRNAVADLISTADDLIEDWDRAISATAASKQEKIENTWQACLAAAYEIIEARVEIASTGNTSSITAAHDTARKRAALCFAQQMLVGKMPRYFRLTMDKLLQEAG